jgi:hypothetical protein
MSALQDAGAASGATMSIRGDGVPAQGRDDMSMDFRCNDVRFYQRTPVWELDPAGIPRSNPKRRVGSRRTPTMKRILLAAILTAFAIGSAVAQESCETKAVGKDGKPLAGAAKTSFMKKCMTDTCATKAVSSDGKPLAGAAKTSFMKKCEKGA